jgi:hypothetical protein
MTKISDSTDNALADLQQNIGTKGAIELLEFALPRIAQRGKELHQYLLAKDWDAAVMIAHQTLSSARLYSSSSFEQRLQQINEKNIAVISTASFQLELQEEFEVINCAIRTWLEAHPIS